MNKIKLSKGNLIGIISIIALLTIIIVVSCVSIFINAKSLLKSENTTQATTTVVTPATETEEETVALGEYKVHSNPTDLQVEYYTELMEAKANYNHDEEDNKEATFKFCELVAKSFVADFYTWTNKIGSFDIGGLYYVWSPTYLNFAEAAKDYFYCDLDIYLSQYDAKDLLEVDSVTVSVIDYAADMTVNDVECNDCYYLEVDWTYKDNSALDESKFQNHANLLIAYNELTSRFEIVYSYNEW